MCTIQWQREREWTVLANMTRRVPKLSASTARKRMVFILRMCRKTPAQLEIKKKTKHLSWIWVVKRKGQYGHSKQQWQLRRKNTSLQFPLWNFWGQIYLRIQKSWGFWKVTWPTYRVRRHVPSKVWVHPPSPTHGSFWRAGVMFGHQGNSVQNRFCCQMSSTPLPLPKKKNPLIFRVFGLLEWYDERS